MITAWSAANTVLYVSSRTLFGLTRQYAQVRDRTKSEYWLGLLGRTSHGAHVPLNAMLFSILVFMWVPYLQLTDQDSALNVRKNTRRGYATCRLRTDEQILGCQCVATPRFGLVRHSMGIRMPCFHPVPSLVCKRLSLMYVSIRLLNSCLVSRNMASPKTRETTCRIYCARATIGELDTHGYRLTSQWQRTQHCQCACSSSSSLAERLSGTPQSGEDRKTQHQHSSAHTALASSSCSLGLS